MTMQQQGSLVPRRPSELATQASSVLAPTWWYSDELRRALISLNREERGFREQIQEEQIRGLEDCKFVAAQTRSLLRSLAAEAKANGINLTKKGGGGSRGSQSYGQTDHRSNPVAPSSFAAAKRRLVSGEADSSSAKIPVEKLAQNQLWYPQSPPRPVSVGFRQLHRSLNPKLPFSEVGKILDEESSVRSWLEGLEHKWREPIVQECVHSWVLLTATLQIETTEQAQYYALVEEEEFMWKLIYRQEFRKRPASVHFAQLVRSAQASASPQRRIGTGEALPASDRGVENRDEATSPISLLSIDQREASARNTMDASEHQERRDAFAWLHERYAVRLFSTVRCEDLDRVAIEEEAEEASCRIVSSFSAS